MNLTSCNLIVIYYETVEHVLNEKEFHLVRGQLLCTGIIQRRRNNIFAGTKQIYKSVCFDKETIRAQTDNRNSNITETFHYRNKRSQTENLHNP